MYVLCTGIETRHISIAAERTERYVGTLAECKEKMKEYPATAGRNVHCWIEDEQGNMVYNRDYSMPVKS